MRRGSLQSSSSALTSIKSSLPHGFVPEDVSTSAAASSAQSGIPPGILDGTLVAPSCIPLPLLGEVRERVGPDPDESVGVIGVGPLLRLDVELRVSVLPARAAFAAGADVGRSMEGPMAEVMLVCKSPVASWKCQDEDRVIGRSYLAYLLAERGDSPPSQCTGRAGRTVHQRVR